jgi:threonine/homoserine/homoserine lactone efflux protein
VAADPGWSAWPVATVVRKEAPVAATGPKRSLRRTYSSAVLTNPANTKVVLSLLASRPAIQRGLKRASAAIFGGLAVRLLADNH